MCLVLLDVSSSLGRTLSLEQTRRHMVLNGVSKIRDTLLGEGLYSKDCSIFACIFGSPVLGNYQISRDCWSSVQKRRDFCSPKGPRTQIIGFKGPNSIHIIVFGP